VPFIGPAYLAAGPFLVGFFRETFLFCDQKKEAKKVPLFRGSGPRPRGCSPLGTPKGWSKKQKAKTCRSAARFLTLFASSPIDPSGAEFYSTIHSVGADARCCGMPHWSIDRCANPSAPKPGCCAVAKQSKPQWGFEAHERARFAGWRRSLCAAKRALSEVAGPFSVPFGVPKGTPIGGSPL